MRSFIFAFLVSTICAATVSQAQVVAPSNPDSTKSQISEKALTSNQLKSLAQALQNEEIRKALVAELESFAGKDESKGSGSKVAAVSESKKSNFNSFGIVVAERTKAAANSISIALKEFWVRLQNAPLIFKSLSGAEASVLWGAFIDLALIILVTITSFFMFRSLGKRIDRKFGDIATSALLLKKIGFVAGSLVIDLVVVVLAWAIGYGVSAIALGPVGEVGTLQALYLNAFLVVEFAKVGVRTVLSPATSGLRPIQLPDNGAIRLNYWISVVVSVLGYGQMLVAPILSDQVSSFAGHAVGVIISLTAIFILLAMVLLNRVGVTAWLLEARQWKLGSALHRLIARGWFWPIIGYLIILLLIVLTRPTTVLLPVIGASGQILGAIILGSIAANGISRSIKDGLHLPPDVNQRLPLLERRLNLFVPRALALVQGFIAVSVVAFALDTAGIINVGAWLASEIGANAAASVISATFMLIIGFVIWLVINSWVDYRLNPDFGSVPTARESTLLTLLKNAATITILAATLMFALSELGVDIAPLIASAGVLGLAIGFGAQKLVQDVITGIFIQFENAMNVGDVVKVGDTIGTVERLTVRSVSLRDLHGIFHIIPFSSLNSVSNYMREFGHYVCDMGIAYREDVDEAKQAMFDAFAELREMEEYKADILEDMTWFGLTTFGDSAVNVRSRIKCAPGKQFAIGRAYNAILKRVFDARGIEIPFPHQTIYFGEDKNGQSPVGRIALSHEIKSSVTEQEDETEDKETSKNIIKEGPKPKLSDDVPSEGST
ncbi:MAG: mechanosensitive ion channel domain-containing protein [Rhodospirillales bacterium]